MNSREQETFFAELRIEHPAWTIQFCSGYVAGVLDESMRPNPKSALVKDAAHLDHYALGYLLAFAIHRGPDCESEPWYNVVGLLVEEHEAAT